VSHKTRFLLLSLVAFALAPIAAADIIHDLTADIVCYPCTYHSTFSTISPHFGAMPAMGSANYTFLGQPWIFSFHTATPISYVDSGPFTFTLQFGQGGTFNMTGPHGLTFAGVVESGNSVNFGLGLERITIAFSGQWSNGWQAVGSVFQRYNVGWPGIPVGEWSELHTHPTSGPVSSTPEPGCVVLLGSAVLTAWRYRARYLG
jgi:hypothetical protein